MSRKDNNIELRSDEVQDIMSFVPNWMIRWGITLIFVLIAVGIVLSWFIRYPDVISGNLTLSTKEPTTKIVSKSSGQITYLTPEGTYLKEGDLIASIKTVLSPEAKELLMNVVDSVEFGLNQDNFKVTFNNDQVFGSLQSSYESLKKSVQEYQFFCENNSLSFEIANLQEQIQNHVTLRSISYQQVRSRATMLSQAQDRYTSVEKLYSQNVVSKSDWFDQKEQLAQAENSLSEAKKASVQASVIITDLKKQLYTLEKDYHEKRNSLLNSINSLVSSIRNDLKNWENTYEIRANKDGRLSYLQKLNQLANIESGKEVFAIISENQSFKGYITVPKKGYGKLKVGQKVRIKLDNYPFQEFGQLEGKVESISLIPNEENYRVEFKLVNGMTSSYGRKLKYTPEMSGVAEIITEDLRLTDRIFNKFKTIF